jgi:hypothetical protein
MGVGLLVARRSVGWLAIALGTAAIGLGVAVEVARG